jgi:general secretion pathway protein A
LKSNGFLLIDSTYNPVYADPESIKILTFPNAMANPPDEIIRQRILSFLPHDIESLKDHSITHFKSGKRRYSCRAFILEDHWKSEAGKARIALILERGMAAAPSGSRRQRRLAGLSEDPFGFCSDARFFAIGRVHKEIFTTLRNMVLGRRGIGVLLGQAGIGKTLLLDSLVQDLRPQSEIAVFPGSFESRKEVVRAVMATLGVGEFGRVLSENLLRLEKWLLSKNLSGRRVTLICDDAQDFSFDTLESLCLFSDLKIRQQKLLQIILAGRQGLLEKLNSNRLRAIGGRINVFSRLSPLDDAEVCNYVSHRLRVAGCTRDLFTSQALASIALYSRGIPLNINMICRHCLSLAGANNLDMVDEKVVADSAYDLVLSTRPAGFWEGPDNPPSAVRRSPSDRAHKHHGLRLVRKP